MAQYGNMKFELWKYAPTLHKSHNFDCSYLKNHPPWDVGHSMIPEATKDAGYSSSSDHIWPSAVCMYYS